MHKNYLDGGLAIVASAALLVGLNISIYEFSKLNKLLGVCQINRLYSQVGARADFNRDGTTTAQEWGKVYDLLEVKFNPRKPESLSPSNLEKFLAMPIEAEKSSH